MPYSRLVFAWSIALLALILPTAPLLGVFDAVCLAVLLVVALLIRGRHFVGGLASASSGPTA